MSTLDRLRELVRGTGRPGSPPASPATSSPVAPGVPASAAARELVYEAVDEAGLPMPVRDDVPDLPGAALCETPVGRCIVIERVFESDAPYGLLRVEDGRVSAADVIGFCAAQMASVDDPLSPDVPASVPAAPGLLSRPYQLDLSQFVDPPFERFDTRPRGRSHGIQDGLGRSWRDRAGAGGANAAALWHGAGAGADADADAGSDGPVMFLDLETTGLSGGAGTVAFLVGCGFFEASGAFRTRQFLLPGFAAERALLHAVASCMAEAGCLVTYNGRTFDLPVMETRWLFHRQPVAWDELTHLDMLHVSRRLWRARGDEEDAGCRLVELERDLFGVERVGDVGGWEIPGRYFDYVRHGQAELLEPVLHHNRLDLLSLALVTARALRLLRDGLEASQDPREWLAIGRELVRLQQRSRAEACFRAVIDSSFASDAVRAEALYAWARQLRRARRFPEAADLWRQLVSCRDARPALRAEAQEALAVHHEHRDRNLDVAHRWATDAFDARTTPQHRDAVAHRLARLRRKMGVQPKGGPKTAFDLPLMATTCD